MSSSVSATPAAPAAAAAAATATAAASPDYTLSARLQPFGAQTVWQEFTPLAKQLGAINCGQGFPDWPAPPFVKEALCRAVHEDANQYARSAGLPALCEALAARYSPLLGRQLDWESEVTVGVGSSECLYACMQALLDPGDEAVLISPAFDIYAAQVSMAGGSCVYVPLRLAPGSGGGGGDTQEWTLDMAELRAALTPRTRVLLLNTPQNPTGKVLTRGELEAVAAMLADFPRVVVVSDEVYENMLYDGREHVRMATLPGMWARTLTVSSAGKTFSVTGWKVGWVIGPAPLVRGVIVTNQWVQFSVSTPAQLAIAYAFERAAAPYEGHASYYSWLAAEYARKRATLCAGLRAAGLPPITPQGSFFIMADTSAVEVPPAYLAQRSAACGARMRRDWAFCKFLAHEVGVIAIPTSAFYEERDKHLAEGVARFAFCKGDDSLEEACRRLRKLRAWLKPEARAALEAGGE